MCAVFDLIIVNLYIQLCEIAVRCCNYVYFKMFIINTYPHTAHIHKHTRMFERCCVFVMYSVS